MKIAPRADGYFQLWKVGSKPGQIKIEYPPTQTYIELSTGEVLNARTGEISPPTPEIKFDDDIKSCWIDFGSGHVSVTKKIIDNNLLIRIYSLTSIRNVPDLILEVLPDLSSIIKVTQYNPQFDFSLKQILLDYGFESAEDFLIWGPIKKVVDNF